MVGLTILAVVAAYIAVVWWLVRFALKNNWTRAAVILAALAIPFWDWPIGYLLFQQHCRTEGGIKRLQASAAVPSILLGESAPYSPDFVFRQGIKTVEYKERDAIVRIDAGRTKSEHKSPASTVGLSVVRNQTLPWNVLRTDTIATRLADNQAIAMHTSFHWLGTWWQVRLAPFFGTGFDCHAGAAELLAHLARGFN